MNTPIISGVIMSASDNYFNYQWHLQDASKVDLNIGDVWSMTGGAGVSVAVVDDGIQTSHARLAKLLPYDPLISAT